MDTTENIVEFLRLRGIEPEVDARDTIEFSAITNFIYTRCVIKEADGTWGICSNVALPTQPDRERWSLRIEYVKPENCVDCLRALLDFVNDVRI